MSSKSRSAFRNRQQIKDEQINYLLGDLEKNLQDSKATLELKEKQLSDAKKILLLAKQSYDKTDAENRNLKAYTENLKQRFQSMHQQQQIQFLEKQRNYYQHKKPTPKKYEEVIYEKEDEKEPDLEQEKDEQFENQEVQKEPEIKKGRAKRKEPSGSKIFEYINKNAKRHK